VGLAQVIVELTADGGIGAVHGKQPQGPERI
jgi:hypothetical protein